MPVMKSVKSFIRNNLINDKHPFIKRLYQLRGERIYHKHKRMTYAQIEAEIGRHYKNCFDRELNWDNPQTYNEKMHVWKVYHATPLKTRLTDKYLVRGWISEKIGDEYLIPLLGVYEKFDDIDFHTLPNKFVIKCNHDCGSVTLVNDKSKVDTKLLRHKYNSLMERNYAWTGFEMHYHDIKPKIIIEQYMGDAINDYKFLCFNSNVYYCWVDFDRYTNHKRNIYNLEWELQPFNQYHYGNYEGIVKRPDCYDKMKIIASELCKGFGHVRVDLYLVDGNIYFGEMTFTNGGGFQVITPEEWTYKLGALWPFDNTVRDQILAQHERPEFA